MKRSPLKPGRPHQVPEYIRTLVKTRCHGQCDFCGQQLNATDLHHRLQRSLGGKDRASNLVALHRRCHNLIHNNIADATASGWLVASHQDPRATPVQLFDGLVWLTDLGGVSR